MFQQIQHKARSLQIYDFLADRAPNEFILSFTNQARALEASVKSRLENFYISYYGPIPGYEISPVSYSSYQEAIENALRVNAQSLSFAREALTAIGTDELGFVLVRYILIADIQQQGFLNSAYANYLHYFA